MSQDKEIPKRFLFEKPDAKDKDGSWLTMRSNIRGEKMATAIGFYSLAFKFYDLDLCKDINDTLEVISIGATLKVIGGRAEAVTVLEKAITEKPPRIIYEEKQEEPTQ